MSSLTLPDSIATVQTVSKGANGEPDLRKFNSSALNSAIDAAMAAMPKDKKVVALLRADLTGARLTIAGRIPSKLPGELDWTVFVDKPYTGKVDAGVGVRWSI